MATVNCPFCGKENPEDNQSCWFCQALLKPQENADAGADDVSWLRALSGQPDSQPQPASEPGIPPDDWLADLRAARPDETTPAPDTFGEGDTPDQLVGQQDFPPSDGENGAVIERLESLGIEPRPAQNEIQDLPAASQPPATDETAERSDDLVESGTDLTDDNMPETGLPDWLAELQRTRSDTPAQPSMDSPFVENGAVQPPPDQDIPVFSSDLSDLDSEETPDWLAGLMAEQPAPQQPPTAEPFPSDEPLSFATLAE
ncbi:MAG: hypothetical protein HPY76_10460, partial [Anaerolineae bacterium]|nr:hypothetical protein [Anaerolineae bacterium]